jgi:hypothetical protein
VQPGEQGVFGAVAPEGVFAWGATKAAAVGGIGSAELVVDGLGSGLGEQGGDVLPALDRFAVIAGSGAVLGFADQQWQVRLETTGKVMVEGGVEVIEGRIGLFSQQEGAAEMQGGLGIR